MDPIIKQKIINSFDQQDVMKTINASIQSIQPGEVILTLPYQAELTQQHGFLHAGIVSTILDSACGYSALTLMPEEAGVLSIEFKVNLMAPAKGEWFSAIGKVKKSGKNITFTQGELFSQTGTKTKLVATMTATMMSVYDRKNIQN
ncbi:MAG: PaaI family thioesterase [Desulfobacteraceae bacterium]|nr:PaaI family thioesterase [Desulfobacteraceae bacterium]